MRSVTLGRRRGTRAVDSMKKKRVCRYSAPIMLSILTLALASSGIRAQESEESRRHGIFIDTVDVSLTNVEVFVTRDGDSVTDLTREDFEILDDGEPVEITHFSRVVGGHRMDAAGGVAAGDADTTSSGDVQSPREPAAIVVLVDQLFVSPVSRKIVFDRLAEQLDGLAESGARIMVASKARSLAIEQPFTSNREEIQVALDRLAGVATPDHASEIELVVETWEIASEAVESRQSGPGQPPPSMTTSEIDARSAFQDANSLSRRIAADVTASLNVLHRFIDSLAGLPGRKAIIYVADRMPVQPAGPLWRIWWEKFGMEHGSKFGVGAAGPSEHDASTALEELISDANTSRVAFYPIGVASGPDLTGAGSRGLGLTMPSASLGIGRDSGDGIGWLAERTGGRAARASGSFEGFFGGIARDLGTYYSLAYPSPHGGDGEVHRLDVRVRRPDVEVRHLTEYRDKSSDQRMADRTLSALTVGVEENPLEVRVNVGKAKRQGDNVFTVPVELHVPLANLVLLPDMTTHHGKLSIQFIVRDEEGRFSDPVIVRMPIEVRHGDMAWALSQTVDYETEMALPGGRQTVAIGVHDDLGFAGSTVKVEVEIEGGSG